MNPRIRMAAAMSVLVLGLTACASDTDDDSVEEPTTEETAEEPAEEETEAEEPVAASPEGEANCLDAVAEEVGTDAATLSVSSVDGTTVTIDVPEAEAPWVCVVESDGSTVSEVFFSTEG